MRPSKDNPVGLGLPHMRRTAAAPHPSLYCSVGWQVDKIAAAGTAAEKALLAGLTARNLGASYVELLRRFKARCRGLNCRWALDALAASAGCMRHRVARATCARTSALCRRACPLTLAAAVCIGTAHSPP